MWERKKGNGRGEKRDDERERKQEKREKGKMERKSETGRLSKLLGPQGICVVSYQACRGMTTMIHTHTHTHTHTQRREARAWQEGTRAKATETWLAGEGRSSSARFLQAIRGSQQHQENLGGPGGRNRQVTSHKHSNPGSRSGAEGSRGKEVTGVLSRQLERDSSRVLDQKPPAPPRLGSRKNEWLC